jgi:PAS domain S-box-containing protein
VKPLVLFAGGTSAPARALRLATGDARLITDDELDGLTAEALAGVNAAVVAGENRMTLLRRLHQLDPTLQLIVLTPAGERAELERALLFAPGLGEVWVADHAALEDGLLARAAAVTAARRSYRSVRHRIASDLALVEPNPARRAVVSDAFLAALLRGVPDPVITLDPDERILSWNAAAERVLAVPRDKAIGRRLPELIEWVDEGRSEEHSADFARRLIRFRRADGQTAYAELIRIPIEWAGRSLSAVVLHDQTLLRRSQTELEEQAVELETANQELQQQEARLREALEARSRFYAAMSHELRTPINAILGYNALLLEGIFGDLTTVQWQRLERAQRAARHLLELVNDVLDLARIEAGRIAIEPETIRFPTLLAELLDTVHALAVENDAPLSVQGPAEPHEIRSDPRRIRQILLNLLSNAVRFGRGRPVVVEWRVGPAGGIEIDVRDQGPGIEPGDQERIFQEFEQVRPQDGSAPDDNGSGLGLAISSRLATLLGGGIRLDSAPGRGSTFTLVLPAALPET